jgi:hypothetical protein
LAVVRLDFDGVSKEMVDMPLAALRPLMPRRDRQSRRVRRPQRQRHRHDSGADRAPPQVLEVRRTEVRLSARSQFGLSGLFSRGQIRSVLALEQATLDILVWQIGEVLLAETPFRFRTGSKVAADLLRCSGLQPRDTRRRSSSHRSPRCTRAPAFVVFPGSHRTAMDKPDRW